MRDAVLDLAVEFDALVTHGCPFRREMPGHLWNTYKFIAIWFLAARQIQRETRTGTARALLRLIHRRMRQRALMIFDLNPITHVDIAAAERAFPEVLGLAQSRAGDLLTDDGAARAWFVEAGDFHLMFHGGHHRSTAALRCSNWSSRRMPTCRSVAKP
jgi:hypothetical protein